jgi:hypothetical protein
MRTNYIKSIVSEAVAVACILLFGAVATFGQPQQINLVASPTTATLPDGTPVPMWGYFCGAAANGSTATCASLNPLAHGTPAPWAANTPYSLGTVVLDSNGNVQVVTAAGTSGATAPTWNTSSTTPDGATLVWTFESSLASYLAASGTWSPVVITVPTGQDLQINVMNNLPVPPGATTGIPTSVVIMGQLGGGLGTPGSYTTPPDHSNAQLLSWPIADPTTKGTPPKQGNRVQSFGTEVATGTTTSLTWTAPRAGTYLLESGTHPSIQVPMGLIGMVVVTTAPSGATAGTAYGTAGSATAVTYNAEVPLLFSEIDPVQNNAVKAAVSTSGFSETMVWSGQPGFCGDPNSSAYHQCYPPAVNYTPRYYLVNGAPFNKTNPVFSDFPASPNAGLTGTGTVLVRLVNAGLRMHVPAIVGAQTGNPAVGGFGLIAEDGNPLPGVTRVQSEVFLAAGKTYDVKINVPGTAPATLPIYDRELSLSSNATGRDGGMLAYIGINEAGTPGAGLPTTGAFAPPAPKANPDSYFIHAGQTLSVLDPAKGVIANDVSIYGVQVVGTVSGGNLTLNTDGTFTFAATAASGSFQYCGNGATSGAACTTVMLNACTTSPCMEESTGITMVNSAYTSNATTLKIAPPGILSADKDGAGYPLTVNAASVSPVSGLTLSVDPNGGFTASVASSGMYTFTYKAQNSQGTVSSSTATVTITFPAPTGLAVTVLDGTDKTTTISDYRWIIEEDRTFYIDPNCTANPPAAGCPTAASGIVPTFGTNFHTSSMPVVATGCTSTLSCEGGQTVLDTRPACGSAGAPAPPACTTTPGQHIPAVCDIGNGVCEPGSGFTPVMPSAVHLDPTKRYYISVLPGDAANPFEFGNLTGNCQNGAAKATDPGIDGVTSNFSATCGHGMGGAPIAAGQTAVTILTQPAPFPPAKLSVFVFEDDFPLNGEHDANGGIDVLATNEPGLGSFQITLFDDAGGTGDATGQPTYDMFNQPLSNSLAGTIDPATRLDACPISTSVTSNVLTGDGTQKGITGMIVTCPRYESDGLTLSPLAGQAIIANLYPGRYGVVATPNADRIARGEEWLQTNTLDGQKAHDSFLRIGEPSYFQEFGPAAWHVTIGFANPAIINSRKAAICNGTDPNLTASNCTHTVTGTVTTERMSRTPDERLYSSGSNDSFAFTQCYVSLGDTDGEDFAFTKCNSDGSFTLTGIPDGDWRVTVFDQWNDMLVDGLSTPVGLGTGYGLCTGAGSSTTTCNLGDVAMNQWQANIYTRTFFDTDGTGVSPVDSQGNPTKPGLALVPTNIRFRDGSYSNFNNTDLNGNAGFNEVFPLFSWYVIETDTTRYKSTGTHVVYDAGGPADGTTCGSVATPPTAPCGSSGIAQFMANSAEQVSVPTNLRVPGAVYCAVGDCTGKSIAGGPASSDPPSTCTTSPTTGVTTCGTLLSTGRIDPPIVHPYGSTYGWQGFSGQNSFIEFGKKPFAVNENGGIHGHVVYASTRPFDDPSLLLQLSWEPLVPHVTINLYQEGTAGDGTQSLTLVDTTTTSSWDDWAQGFRTDGNPNMNCPGQLLAPTSSAAGDLFFFSLYKQPNYLDFYNSQHGGPAPTALPNNSQFKCYDGMHNWNQIQPAPYDGMYRFPSITSIAATGPTPGKPAGTNCTICSVTDTDGNPMLPAGKYVVEVVVPPGYELVKEEDKNILIGDNYIAPATVQFPGLGGAIYILPDQAAIGATYNPNNAQNPTTDLGVVPRHEGDTGSVEVFWPCVGQARTVPDYISLFPGSSEVAPFAGAMRNLCDRKEVTLTDQSSVLAKFYIFTSTHVAAHFTGVITDDFTSEFDPFSPQFGEKFSPANLPISIKDWAGNEISRVYSDHWGTYDGLTYSTWEVNPPNPTGYAPQMMVTCMNDPGTGTTPDPLFNPAYSQFCYEIPFMPGQTQYMDTPVVPTSAFAGAGYNNPDCDYPDGTPGIKQVNGDGVGPWVSAAGHSLTITSLGVQTVGNYAYSGPSATAAPFNQKTLTRNYGFGVTAPTSFASLPPPPTGFTYSCSSGSATTVCPNVTVGGQPLAAVSWGDTTITGTVPASVPTCKQQQSQYSGVATRCGELVITAANGKQSIDGVTVTIETKLPTHVLAAGSVQAAIDAAAPGDLIIVDPGVHNELLLMWKPVRLQGVGAASSVINANTQPAGKLDPWRAQVSCLFGLALNGQPISNGSDVPLPGANIPGDPNFGKSAPANQFDPTSTFSCPGTMQYFGGSDNNPQVDRIPLEGILGWDTTVNGNLAQLLQEPSLMGAYEGAGITVLAKGVRYPAGVEIFGGGHDNTAGSNVAHEGQFPESATQGTNLLTNRDADCLTGAGHTGYSSNFLCNPSRIDGLSITNSSQGGGGIFVHGWAHGLEIANNRVYNNTGTMTGGITVGQGETPDALVAGNNGDPLAGSGGFGGLDQQPWTCVPGAVTFGTNGNPILGDQNPSPSGFATNAELPFCYNVAVNVHHNYVTRNSSIGDEVFSGTPAGAGGVTFCTGADYYKFQYNWVCGNLSTGDGGGLAHVGFSYNGDIEHNSILFNQSTNPTIATNGGGLIVMGAAPDSTSTLLGGAECGAVTDVDCAPGLSDGTGPGLLINANLFQGNAAESGSGGGIRFQDVNGTEVALFPNGSTAVAGRNNVDLMYGGPGGTSSYYTRWNSAVVTNNIIVNNVAGWDGGGVSFQDALAVRFINNTVASNDSTASAGPLFNTLGSPNASAPGSSCTNAAGTASCPQVAGLVTMRNTGGLTGSLTSISAAAFVCPTGNFTTTDNCRNFSVPLLYNNVFWQNHSYFIGVGGLGAGGTNQQNVVALYNPPASFNGTAGTQVATQPTTDATTPNGGGSIITGGTGACISTNTQFWDIGVRGDSGPGNHGSTLTLAPIYSVISSGGYGGTGDTTSNPTVISQYCNGSRTPPEFNSLGWQVPAGIADATVPNPIFNLTPAATVDEGNNWINISWGPLTMTGPTTGAALGNYGPASTSSVINRVPSNITTNGATGAYTLAPSFDFYGNSRKNGFVDAGAVEFAGGAAGTAGLSVTGGPLSFVNVPVGGTSAAQTLTLHNTGTITVTGITLSFSDGHFTRSGGTCTTTLTVATGTCTINVVFSPTAITTINGATLTITATNVSSVSGSPVTLSGNGVAPTISATLTPTTWSAGSHPRNCPGIGILGMLACAADGNQVFTLTNTGNVPLTGIAQGVLGGPNAADYTIVRIASTCGPTGNGQLAGLTTLNPGASCVVTVGFRPLTSEAAGTKSATVSVTDLAGTQISTLSGNAQ